MTPNKNNAAPRAATAGNTLFVVLLTIAVLSLVAGNLMWSASARYHVTYQSASWQEALVAAEAGVDVGMLELRNHFINHTRVFSGPGWSSKNTTAVYDASRPSVRALLGGAVDPLDLPDSFGNRVNPDLTTFPDNGHAFPLKALPTRQGEGNTTLAYRVYVDVPDSDAVTTKTATGETSKQALAQPAPGTATDPEDPNLKFISQPDEGGSEKDTHDREVNMSRWWWRIRAVGYAGVSGPARPSPDGRDGRLRRFSFFTDWRNGGIPFLPGQPTATAPHPQVSRVIEVLAQPRTRTHFALLADQGIDLGGKTVRVDSYDSTKGDYGALIATPPTSASNDTYTAPGSALDPNGNVNPAAGRNIGWLGNLATNGQLINAGGATVVGSAMTNNGTVTGAQNVTGAEDPNFYQDLTPIKPQDWNDVATVPTVTTPAVYRVLSTDPRNPTRFHLNGINLTGGAVVSFTTNDLPVVPPLAATQHFVKLYVEGDILTTGTSAIRLAPNVSAIIYVEGKVSLVGTGIDNQSKLPTHLVINGIKPADNSVGGDAHSITISPYGTDKPAPPPKGDKEDKEDKEDKKDKKDKKTPAPLPVISTIANGDFTGIIYAPQHDLFISGSGTATGGVVASYDYAGAFAANHVTVSVDTAIHFDESLRGNGQLGGYKLVNWFEDTTSRVVR